MNCEIKQTTRNLQADIRLPRIFNDNMVLQQEKAIPLWGWATPGKKVTVTFKSHVISTVTKKNGTWKVVFPAMKADTTPANMEIESNSCRKTIFNILIGEVWICSGQSNMEFPLRDLKDSAKTINNADYPILRVYNIYPELSGYPKENFTEKWIEDSSDNISSFKIHGKWVESSPKTASSFSVVGFYFARNIMQKLKVPVGLINASVGCTSIEAWISRDGFGMIPALKANSEKIRNADKDYEKKLRECLPLFQEWLHKVKKNRKIVFPEFPQHFLATGRERGCYKGMETGHFNAMISPLIHYPIRGVIWYQGETNQADGIYYAEKMDALVSGWRKAWGYDFPFYFVQIPPHPYSNLPAFWLGQYIAAKKIKNCDIVCTADLGDMKECHPQKKEPIGIRLAALALYKTYKRKNLSVKSPYFKKIKVNGEKVRVFFENVSKDGLASSNGKPLTWFEISGNDGHFHKAKAEIENKTVLISSGKVKKPVFVRFAWSQFAQPNLCDKKTFLPVFPFHSQLFSQHRL